MGKCIFLTEEKNVLQNEFYRIHFFRSIETPKVNHNKLQLFFGQANIQPYFIESYSSVSGIQSNELIRIWDVSQEKGIRHLYSSFEKLLFMLSRKNV